MRQWSHHKTENEKLNLVVRMVSQGDAWWLWLAASDATPSAMVHKEKLDWMESYGYGANSTYMCDLCGDTQTNMTQGNDPRN